MKKIIIIMLLLFASKQIALAQQITSTLTQLTTDLMRTENRNNFSWRTVQYSRLNVHQSIKNYFDIMVDDGDGGTGGGNNGGGSNCYCVDRGFSIGMEEVYANGMILWCHKCSAGGTDCNGTLCGELSGNSPPSSGSNPPPPANNNPFNWGVGGTWGSLPWGNLGGIYTGGFLYPPTSVPPASYGGGSNGGGGSAPPSTFVPTSNPIKPIIPTEDDEDNIDSTLMPAKDTSYSIIIGNGLKKYKDGDTIKVSAIDTCINWSIESSKGSITASGINWKRNKSTIARNSLSANICQYFDGNFKISVKKGKNELISVILKDTIICPTDANLKVTPDMLLRMYPEAKKERCDSVSKYLNMYMKDYKINTRKRLAHFLTQVFVETGGFSDRTEGVYKTKERIIEIFKDKKKIYNFIDTSNVARYVNCICLFDRVYAYKDGNGDEASKDGSLFRGRGAIQLTSRSSYTDFTKFYQQKYNDYNTSFVTNPELVADNWKYFVLAALWEFSIDKNALEFADRDNINKVSRIVNGGDNLLPVRQAQLPITKSKLCL